MPMRYRITLTGKKFILLNLCMICLLCVAYFFANYKAWNQELPSTCIMKIFFHLYCPGCGCTRAIYVLLRGHVIKAILFNPFIPYVCFWCAYYYIRFCISIIKNKTHGMILINLNVIWTGLVILIVFFILRNILLVTGIWDYIGDLSKYYPFK